MKKSIHRRSAAHVISAYERREKSGRLLRFRALFSVSVALFCAGVTVWSTLGSRFLLRQLRDYELSLDDQPVVLLGVHFPHDAHGRADAADTAHKLLHEEPHQADAMGGNLPIVEDQHEAPDRARVETDNKNEENGAAQEKIVVTEPQPPANTFQRAKLLPDDLSETLYLKISPMKVPSVSNFVRDVTGDRPTLLETPQDYRDSYRITKGLKLYVAPVSDHTLFCLSLGKECDNTLGCWDKRLWLFAREAFSDVEPAEADFVLMPYFHYCFFYMTGCYAQVGRRKATTMDILSLIYNDTMNHLDRVAPGRDWSGRLVVPLSHDYGGCVAFGLTEKEKKQRIRGQPPILQDAIVVGAMGDYDETCYIPGKDIVFPAFVDHATIDEPIIRSSHRKFQIYFGGTLRFDLRKPGLRKILTDPANYQHMNNHVIGYVKPRSNYSHVIHNTAFCLGPPGVVGWTGRVWEALWAGCIPVFLTENTAHPWEEYINYSKFSLHYSYADAPIIEQLLDKVSPEERDQLQAEGQKVRDMFVFKPPFTQEKGPISYLFKTLRRRKTKLDNRQHKGH